METWEDNVVQIRALFDQLAEAGLVVKGKGKREKGKYLT